MDVSLLPSGECRIIDEFWSVRTSHPSQMNDRLMERGGDACLLSCSCDLINKYVLFFCGFVHLLLIYRDKELVQRTDDDVMSQHPTRWNASLHLHTDSGLIGRDTTRHTALWSACCSRRSNIPWTIQIGQFVKRKYNNKSDTLLTFDDLWLCWA